MKWKIFSTFEYLISTWIPIHQKYDMIESTENAVSRIISISEVFLSKQVCTESVKLNTTYEQTLVQLQQIIANVTLLLQNEWRACEVCSSYLHTVPYKHQRTRVKALFKIKV